MRCNGMRLECTQGAGISAQVLHPDQLVTMHSAREAPLPLPPPTWGGPQGGPQLQWVSRTVLH